MDESGTADRVDRAALSRQWRREGRYEDILLFRKQVKATTKAAWKAAGRTWDRWTRSIGGHERARTFYRLWSLKEAALKSIGEGLPFGLEAFEFELTPALRVVRAPEEHGGPGQFDAYLVEGTGACAALAVGKRP